MALSGMCEVRPPSNTHPQDYEAIELLGIAGVYRWVQIDSKKRMVGFLDSEPPSRNPVPQCLWTSGLEKVWVV